MRGFYSRHPVWSGIIAILVAILLWMIFALWPDWLTDAIGRKKIFLNALFNGVTLGGLYFLVASGFTLIFGLMRNVNLAHGSLYLLGGYVGFLAADWTGYWLLAFPAAFVVVAALGVLLQIFVFRRMEGEDLRQTLVTIGISIVLADLMLWIWGRLLQHLAAGLAERAGGDIPLHRAEKIGRHRLHEISGGADRDFPGFRGGRGRDVAASQPDAGGHADPRRGR